jgi:tetratricopeptide (TPR) repeat protein
MADLLVTSDRTASGAAIRAGLRFHQSGRLREAAECYHLALIADPDAAEAHHMIGVVTYQMGRRGADAVAHFERAIALSPDEPRFYCNLALVLRTMGRFADAATNYAASLELHPYLLEAMLGLATIFYAGGHAQEAAVLYRSALKHHPGCAEALTGLGCILDEAGACDEAEECFTAACNAPAGNGVAHYNLGLLLKRQGRLDDAERHLLAACRKDPARAESHIGLGAIYQSQRRLDDAARCYARATQLEPDNATALNNLATVLVSQGEHVRAEGLFRRALHLQPHNPDVMTNLGNALHALNRPADAEAAHRAAIQLQPGHAEAWNNLGQVLQASGQLAKAAKSFGEAIRLRPDYLEPHGHLCQVLFGLGRMTEAETLYRTLLRRWPDEPMLLNDLGIVFLEQDRVLEAEQTIRAALDIRADYAEALGNLALIMSRRQRLDLAERYCRDAILVAPESAQAHFNLAALLLLTGQYPEGWREYEYRWRTDHLKQGHGFPQPLWRGEKLEGRTLLLHAEQGFGDTLQFCRYGSLLAGTGTIVMVVPRDLVDIVSSLRGVSHVTCQAHGLPPADLQCPLASMPLAFGTTVETIPAESPYLWADTAKSALWRRKVAEFCRMSHGQDALKIGLVWAGSSRADIRLAAVDRRRSTSLEAFAPLAAVRNCLFISLQKGPASVQAAHPPAGMTILDAANELSDFSDTAALIDALDLVISVDTAVAHLAGALGKPVWLLNRFDTCWRWLLHRDDSPWYPTLRQFRQAAPGDWRQVMGHVAEQLETFSRRSTQMKPSETSPRASRLVA